MVFVFTVAANARFFVLYATNGHVRVFLKFLVVRSSRACSTRAFRPVIVSNTRLVRLYVLLLVYRNTPTYYDVYSYVYVIVPSLVYGRKGILLLRLLFRVFKGPWFRSGR